MNGNLILMLSIIKYRARSGEKVSSLGFNRRKEVVYTRIRLGHTGLNSALKLIGKGNGCAECAECNVKEHVIFNCKKYDNFRMKRQEVEAENDRLINYILEERDRIKACIMFLNFFLISLALP